MRYIVPCVRSPVNREDKGRCGPVVASCDDAHEGQDTAIRAGHVRRTRHCRCLVFGDDGRCGRARRATTRGVEDHSRRPRGLRTRHRRLGWASGRVWMALTGAGVDTMSVTSARVAGRGLREFETTRLNTSLYVRLIAGSELVYSVSETNADSLVARQLLPSGQLGPPTVPLDPKPIAPKQDLSAAAALSVGGRTVWALPAGPEPAPFSGSVAQPTDPGRTSRDSSIASRRRRGPSTWGSTGAGDCGSPGTTRAASRSSSSTLRAWCRARRHRSALQGAGSSGSTWPARRPVGS